MKHETSLVLVCTCIGANGIQCGTQVPGHPSVVAPMGKGPGPEAPLYENENLKEILSGTFHAVQCSNKFRVRKQFQVGTYRAVA
jgi:hypothetical protein